MVSGFKRLATSMVLAGSAAALVTLGATASASAAPAGYYQNEYQGTYDSAGQCQDAANWFNANNGYPNSQGEYFYCGSDNPKALWFRDYIG